MSYQNKTDSIINIIDIKIITLMIKCRFCEKGFVDSLEGLAEKTFHEVLHEEEIVNEN